MQLNSRSITSSSSAVFLWEKLYKVVQFQYEDLRYSSAHLDCIFICGNLVCFVCFRMCSSLWLQRLCVHVLTEGDKQHRIRKSVAPEVELFQSKVSDMIKEKARVNLRLKLTQTDKQLLDILPRSSAVRCGCTICKPIGLILQTVING